MYVVDEPYHGKKAREKCGDGCSTLTCGSVGNGYESGQVVMFHQTYISLNSGDFPSSAAFWGELVGEMNMIEYASCDMSDPDSWPYLARLH